MKRVCVILAIFLFSCRIAGLQAQEVDIALHRADSLSAQPDKALEIINRAVAATPTSEELLRVRAEIYIHLKNYDKAADDYLAIAKLEPDDETAWYTLGQCQYKGLAYDKALQSLNRATKLNPQYLPAFHTKINIMLAQNRPADALKVSDSTLMVGETSMNYFLQGKVNERLGAKQKAEWAYNKAIKLDKGFIDAYIALANLSADMNKTDETLSNAEAALGIDPDSQEALIARSRGLALSKQYNDAIDDVSYVLRQNPDNADARYWRASYYKDSNKPQEALKDYDALLKAQPGNWQALAGQADCYASIGNRSQALTDYKALLDKASSYPEKEAITQLANSRIFELNRENHPPEVVVEGADSDFEIRVPDSRTTLTLRGTVTDENPIGSLLLNGQKIAVEPNGKGGTFAVELPLNQLNTINIEVADVYENTNRLSYHVVRSETEKPQITLFTPKPDEHGMLVVTSDNPVLYIEGRVNDASSIASITVDGKDVDFDRGNVNPSFSSVVDINGRTSFTIVATDRYGNSAEQSYTLDRVTAAGDTVPHPQSPPAMELQSSN